MLKLKLVFCGGGTALYLSVSSGALRPQQSASIAGAGVGVGAGATDSAV